ncbi:geminin coiled-coil domain-containing protein 1 [Periophthalmus magnuspinnatus]|uniref:geminin coiled-coil domain-containing protein 1 n=1 Tax=Periophthalmus magnuspinnatus TaxID=409849 RepID=UPI00145A7194|nr:geminin coiled-coil domain-containing protein 1 [Periophthalmus magnuspinnatus]
METLASFWSHDPFDLGQSRHEVSALWETCYVENNAPSVSCAMWTELSPHLQKNKQLHDTLLQREEELARLQEENQKLRQFLNSSLVKDLEEKAKTLCANGKRKRNLSFFTPPISKRVCRNLTAEICSESEPSETSLDLWVLKTLGLKDKDTIDTGADHNNNITNHYHSPLEHNTDSCNVYQSPITAIMLQASPNPSENQDGKDSGFANKSNQNGASLMRSSRPVLAFSMSLSPNHSLKTHSFPHGQAFVRRDTKGRCSFTWVPRDRP